MTRMVPAIDLIDGRCVRLQQGDFSTAEVVGQDPVQVAREFQEQGFSRLHVVDLSGARVGEPKHLDVLYEICRATTLKVDYSGGLRRESDVDAALNAGAAQVVLGSAAVKQRSMVESLIDRKGSDRVIIGVDVVDDHVQVNGWEEGTALSLSTIVSWYLPLGLKYILSTDVTRDGMLTGPNIDLYSRITQEFPELLILASGGVGCADDIRQLARQGVYEIIVGKALYSEALSLDEVRECVW
jgi:phosphoribosylformimino-5-aminoimidazole carboxamide ribotide isomerase